jgi:hypothetical protein
MYKPDWIMVAWFAFALLVVAAFAYALLEVFPIH